MKNVSFMALSPVAWGVPAGSRHGPCEGMQWPAALRAVGKYPPGMPVARSLPQKKRQFGAAFRDKALWDADTIRIRES